MSIDVTIFVDGASRGNPGKAGVGVHIHETGTSQPLMQLGCFLGKATNNVAEYAALALGLHQAHSIKNLGKLSIFADSELLVKQVNGIYRVRNPHLRQWHSLVSILGRDLSFSLAHVRREKNSHADRLANSGIDERVSLPDTFAALVNQHITTQTTISR